MKLVAILDDVRSVHNVGSIFRTADAAGVSKVFCCGITPGPLDRFKHVRPDFAKVALGAEQSVAWEAGQSLTETIQQLKEDGWMIFAVEQTKNSIPYDEVLKTLRGNSDIKVALIVGNEVGGVSPEILSMTDGVVEIPMRGKKESLNVAVAFGIVVFGMLQYEKWRGAKK